MAVVSQMRLAKGMKCYTKIPENYKVSEDIHIPDPLPNQLDCLSSGLNDYCTNITGSMLEWAFNIFLINTTYSL